MKLTGNILNVFNLNRLTGPIFDKELRISSRRKRNYVLRIAYLGILAFLVIAIWSEEVNTKSSNIVYQVSRLSRAGLLITSFVVGFQFYAAQILAAIMLSNSISDEIYNKTLGVLMSTPITSVQIIVGKLLSKLLQIGMLLCFTLPILGIIRVFGGVPWEFLVSSFCITFTAVLFAAMVSINLSIQRKHAYSVIIASIITLLGLYVLLPLCSFWVAYEWLDIKNQSQIVGWFFIANPIMTIHVLLEELIRPGGTGITSNAWWWNCLVMLTGSLLLFLRAVVVVRKKALLQACGQLDVSRKRKKNGKVIEASSKVRRIRGNPMLWKELRIPFTRASGLKRILLLLLIAAAIAFGYYICAKERMFRHNDIHVFFAILYMIIGIFFTSVIAATTITSERHSQNWPLLLGTLIGDWSIIGAKIAGVIRRSLPFWMFLFGHVVVFILIGYIHPSALLHLLIIVIPMIFLVTSSGLLFSTLLKRTTSAVINNMIFVAFIWGGILYLMLFISIICGQNDDMAEFMVAFNPFYHAGVIMNEAAGSKNAAKALAQLNYDWDFGINNMRFWGTTFMLCGINIINVTFGFVLLAIAKANFRKRIFR